MRLSYVMLAVAVIGCGGGGGDGYPTGNSGGNNTGGTGNTGGGSGTGTAGATASVSTTQSDDGYGTAVFAFSPASVTITRGGTVTWTNESSTVVHNVTFSTAGSPTNINNFTSSAGSVSRQFNTAGTYSYSCTNHTGMTGSVKVE
jgi:plastocyanin